MKAPFRLPQVTDDDRAWWAEIERDFHIRAFGEELARVNLDLTEAERIQYIGWMRRTAAKHGVKPGVSHEWEWMQRVEEELERESK